MVATLPSVDSKLALDALYTGLLYTSRTGMRDSPDLPRCLTSTATTATRQRTSTSTTTMMTQAPPPLLSSSSAAAAAVPGKPVVAFASGLLVEVLVPVPTTGTGALPSPAAALSGAAVLKQGKVSGHGSQTTADVGVAGDACCPAGHPRPGCGVHAGSRWPAPAW